MKFSWISPGIITLRLAVAHSLLHPAPPPALHEGDVVAVPHDEGDVGGGGVVHQPAGRDVLPGGQEGAGEVVGQLGPALNAGPPVEEGEVVAAGARHLPESAVTEHS